MIAFVQLPLHGGILVPADEPLTTLEMQDVELDGVGPVRVIVHPPYRSLRSTSAFRVGGAEPLIADADLLNPADPQPSEEMIVVDGERPVVLCDAIAVEIHAPAFDRRRESPGEHQAIFQLACDAVDGILERIRVLTRASHLGPLRRGTHRLVFLDDDRNRMPREDGKYVETGVLEYTIQSVAVTPAVWQAVTDVGTYEIPAWDALLLDAFELDIELGPSLVLAATAVETRIANALDVLAQEKIPEDVWEWMTSRRNDFTKTPTVSEQLDELLDALGGRSLKEDPRLWEAGSNLRTARNSFVHQGRAIVGKQPVTPEKARELRLAASEIIDFIEALLPETERRPRLEHTSTITTTVKAQTPAAGGDPAVDAAD